MELVFHTNGALWSGPPSTHLNNVTLTFLSLWGVLSIYTYIYIHIYIYITRKPYIYIYIYSI